MGCCAFTTETSTAVEASSTPLPTEAALFCIGMRSSIGDSSALISTRQLIEQQYKWQDSSTLVEEAVGGIFLRIFLPTRSFQQFNREEPR